MKAVGAVLVLFIALFIWPGSGYIYDLLAAPLMSALPEGAKMIATGVITMFLAFGVTFEIPIVVIVLVRMGIVTVEQLRDARPYVIVGAFVVAAVVTPPDVLSQFMLAVPMCVLYEAGLFCARFISRSGSVRQDSTDPAR